jgi:hypothetical protein
MSTLMQNRNYKWVPAIPIPYYWFGMKACKKDGCDLVFFTMRGYRGHYALVHIVEAD